LAGGISSLQINEGWDGPVSAKSWAAHLVETRSGYGTLAMRGIEVGAAVVIVAFGTLLLAGYIATERMVGI
jgi:nickel/cobalt exporter